MKRKMAFLLAVILIVSTGFMAYATEPDSGIPALPGETTTQEPTAQPEEGGNPAGVLDLPETSEVDDLQENSISEITQAPGSEEGVSEPGTEQTPGSEEEISEPGIEQVPESEEEISEPGTEQTPGSEEDISEPETEQEMPQEETDTARTAAEEMTSVENTGQVEVVIGASLSFERSVDFEVRLERAAAEPETGMITVGGTSEGEGAVHFQGLSDGLYTLTVSSKGFATYTQEIRVEGKAYSVKLMTGFLEGIKYMSGTAHPGVLVLGDVTGNDGLVDEADMNAMVDAIDQGIAPDQRDLNGDGRIDLVDLEFFAKTYNVPEHIEMQAGVEESVSSAVITPTAGNGTQVEGNLQSLLESSGSVVLKQVWGNDISEETPVSVKFEFNGPEAVRKMDGIVIENKNENPITAGVVNIVYVDENGIEQEPIEKTFAVGEDGGITLLLEESDVAATQDGQGNIRLFLGGQIAVKRVTLTITGMRKSSNLAEISKVEFVNGMETRIPEPEMDVPKNLEATAGSQIISLEWDPCVNVTGYEVSIRQGEQENTVMVSGNALDIVSFNQDKLTNYLEYRIKVQAVNGTWRSGYGEEVTAIPMPGGPPDPPDNVNAAGQYKSVAVSWKKMDDTLSYNVYYKEKESGDEAYQKIAGEIEANRFVIDGLEDLTAYTVYVTGVNECGESRPSVVALATTTDSNAAVMPKYKLINTGEPGQKGAHIISATKAGTMNDSPLDTETNTAWGTVDHDPASHYYAGTWDVGGFNALGNNGLKYEFDEEYVIDRFAFHDLTSRDGGYGYVSVRCWDEDGNLTYTANQKRLTTSSDADGRKYYIVKLSEAVKAKKIQFGIARGTAVGTITISEVYFYYYDSIFDDIMALYEDDLHVVLKPDVTQKMIDDLRERINTADPVSGELHPEYEMLKRELENAEDILNAVGLSEPVQIHNTIISNEGVNRKFGGLNAWQPLGVTAAANDKIMVYVGHNTKKTGDTTTLKLVATQYNSEAGAMYREVATLKVGANEITIPQIWSLDYESGGALYVQYSKPNGNTNDQYAVRVSGGVQVPVLDLYHVENEADRLAKTTEYVEKLGSYVSQMEDIHEREHYYSTNPLMKARTFDNQTCILGASDIMLDTMMFSLPAQQIWAGSGANGGSTEARARTILKSMDSMEEMMYLFYQHKGLNENAPNLVDRIPACHQNIRYQRMFAKAFMYASGNHIGIGWGSTAGMVASAGVVSDENGMWQSGSYFGWGIAHEIGHCINQGDYSVAEITNNYFSVLAQAKETNDSVRFQYSNVYDKVTSGAKGRASNVFTQLGLYWQLHLAYDNGYNYKTYENYDEQLANLFFARVDTYSRTPSRAPAPDGVALTLSGEEQNLMRLSCAAAEKNLLEFFRRWGMTPDETTEKYASQFEPENRAVYYVNDEARAYRLAHGIDSSVLNTEDGTKVNAVSDAVTAELVDSNRIDIKLSFQNIPEEDILGYEIIRCMYAGGEVIEEPVGFAAGSVCTYSDIISTINNRTVFYKIKLIDKYLYSSAEKVLPPLKIEHDGSLDKSSWTVTTGNLTVDGETGTGSSNTLLYCDPENETSYEKDKLIDNQVESIYTATAGNAPEITLNFNKTLTVAGFKVTAGEGLSGAYEIQVRCDGSWETVAESTFGTEAVQTIHFANADNAYVSTYEADAVKLVLKTAAGSKVSIAELDVLGVTGDNVDFRRTEGDNTAVIGILKETFRFGEDEDDVIPEGSIVFAGAYKGNAAYNSVLLFDQDGNNIGTVTEVDGELQVKADSVILADVPDAGDITNVKNGTWIYWVEPGTDLSGVEKVRAELYRVNDALTNEGQRLVSDSLFEEMPEELPFVTIDGNTGLQE